MTKGVEEGTGSATININEAAVKKDRRAFIALMFSITDAQQSLVRGAAAVREAWSLLERHHEKKGFEHGQYLRRQLSTMRMVPGTSVLDFILKMKNLANELAVAGVPVPDKELVVTLLGSLPNTYRSLVMGLGLVEEDRLTIDFVISRVQAEEMRIKSNSKGDQNQQAFYAGGGDKQVKSNKKKNSSCFNCGKPGHFARDCRSPRKAEEKGKQNKPDKEVTGAAFTAIAGVNKEPELLSWCVDSGATHHLSSTNVGMMGYQVLEEPVSITIADENEMVAAGKGDIIISIKGGIKLKLLDVLYVPRLSKNLLSVPKATSKGVEVKFSGDYCIFKAKGGVELARAHKENGLYKLQATCVKGGSAYTARLPVPDQNVWHHRFGHANVNGLQQLQSKGGITGLGKWPALQPGKACETCLLTKMPKMPFPKGGATRAIKTLERVHTDVCGPMQETAIDGSRYYVSFIDDYSRHISIFPIASKDQAFEVFRVWEAAMERSTGNKVKSLRSDNGGEYDMDGLRTTAWLRGS